MRKNKICLTTFWALLILTFNTFPANSCSTELGWISGFSDPIYDIEVVGSYAYTVSGTGGFKIVDLSNPVYPTIVDGISTAESAIRLDVLGNYAYVTAGKGYLYVIDITNPQNPILKDSLQVGTSSTDHGRGIKVVGSYAYVTTYESGLHIVDVSDPEDIFQTGSFSASYAYCVEIYGNYAYIGRGTGYVQIVDITDPSAPTSAGSFSSSGPSYRIALRWPYLFIANGDLIIYDITNPTSPSFVKSFSMSNITMDVSLSEDGMFAYFANCNDQGGYAVVVNVSDIDDPILECSFYDRWIKSVGIFGKLAISGSSTGLKTAEFDLPPVLSVSVNPNQGRIEGTISGQQTLIINCGDGQTDCSELLTDLDQIELTAYPKAGYAFDYFDDGVSCYGDNPLDLTMSGDVEVEGVFGQLEFKLPLAANKDWLLTVEAGGDYLYGPPGDQYHTGGGHFSLDFVDHNQQDGHLQGTNVPILAAEGGKVLESEWNVSYGWTVVIDHDYPFDGTGILTRYAHLAEESTFSENNSINRGDELGIMGNTGSESSGIHLHLHFYYNGSSADSLPELEAIEMEDLLLEDYQVGCGTCDPWEPEFYPSTNE